MNSPSSPDNSSRSEKMSILIKEAHAHQTRDGGKTPYWVHCESVAKTLETLFQETGEMDENDMPNILDAAKGHDLYEDTTVTPALIQNHFGKQVHDLIDGMTNWEGDENRAEYVERMKQADEKVRLIKLADLYDNYSGGVKALISEGETWVKEFLLPILDEMWAVVQQTQFQRYPKTAEKLMKLVRSAHERLHVMVDTKKE